MLLLLIVGFFIEKEYDPSKCLITMTEKQAMKHIFLFIHQILRFLKFRLLPSRDWMKDIYIDFEQIFPMVPNKENVIFAIIKNSIIKIIRIIKDHNYFFTSFDQV